MPLITGGARQRRKPGARGSAPSAAMLMIGRAPADHAWLRLDSSPRKKTPLSITCPQAVVDGGSAVVSREPFDGFHAEYIQPAFASSIRRTFAPCPLSTR